MSDRSWSPPLDLSTRTLQSLSIIRARPEHLPAIHKIQMLAYPGRTDFHEAEDVFRSKMEAYPAGNFVALATYSVVTQDDTSTWVGAEEEGDRGEVEEVEGEEEEDKHGEVVHGISVVEITETGPDGSSTTTTATSTTTTIGGETVEHIDIVRARTPDIQEGTDDEDDGSPSPIKWSTGLDVPHARHGHGHEHGQDSKSAGGGNDAAASSATSASAERAGRVDEEEEDTTVLFQWEEPVGYLFSHPYSRESVTLHRMGAHTATTAEGKEKAEASSKPKRIRLEGGGTDADKNHPQDDDQEESEGETKYDHDQLMEKYYIHDCAIHPSWRGQGLASKLWKALEESLFPKRDVHGGEGASGAGEGASGDLVDTEEEEEGSEGHSEDAGSDDNTASKEASTTRRRRGGRLGSKKTRSHAKGHSGPGHGHRHRRRKGAPNLKEIVLVSVQGTKPFWQRAGGFDVVADHDMDLSVYGAEGEAFLMRKMFIF
ncbi:MAG: hypothetical protein JOS17DRAFT_780919 [Linnemannia elongata]|nr:MAG: hypothetical protein JOS17DRAFT_780919 [Linnemannia elongata]